MVEHISADLYFLGGVEFVAQFEFQTAASSPIKIRVTYVTKALSFTGELEAIL